MRKTLGQPTRSSGAAESTIRDVHPQCHRSFRSCRLYSLHCHRPLLIPTIAPMGLRIGRLDGACRRRSGVAGSTAKVALVNSQVGVRLWELLQRHMIAMPASQIGWRGGRWPKRLGVARMLARVVLRQLAGVLELETVKADPSVCGCLEGAQAPPSGAQFSLCARSNTVAWQGCDTGASAIFRCRSLAATDLMV